MVLHHPYGFGGKEENDELGFGTLDFGARNYDPSLGRWFNIDPFAEFMRNQSPYNFGFNNPIYFSDYGGTIPWPVPEMFKNWVRRIDSRFGMRTRRGRTKLHAGIDINFTGGGNTDYGAPVVATHSGKVTVVITSNTGSAGRYIEITSPDGTFKTRYLHLSSIVVKEDQEISEGQSIGLLGGSGYGLDKSTDGGITGYVAHLHYEIHRNGVSINPLDNKGNPIDPQRWIEPDRMNYYNESDYQMALYDHENEGAMYENEDLIENNDMSPPAREREELSEIGITPSGLHEFDIPLPESDLRLPNNIPAQNQDYPINIPQRDSFWDRY